MWESARRCPEAGSGEMQGEAQCKPTQVGEEKEWSTGVMDHFGAGCLECFICCFGFSKANEIAEKLELEPQCGIPWGCC